MAYSKQNINEHSISMVVTWRFRKLYKVEPAGFSNYYFGLLITNITSLFDRSSPSFAIN
jgi:hypothetical protein